MARTVTINYARITRSQHQPDPTTGNDTITVYYVVGHKDPTTGQITDFTREGMQGCANGTSVTYLAPGTNTGQQTMQALVSAVASQEGLSLASGDIVAMS